MTREVSATAPAARVDDKAISVAELDARSTANVQRIRERLVSVAASALHYLIDDRLRLTHAAAGMPSTERAQLYRARRVELKIPPPQVLESGVASDAVVATVGAEPVLGKSLEEAAALRLYRLRGELYLQRRRQLDELIEQRLLELEAESRGLSVETLERSLTRPMPVSHAEVAAFIAAERLAGRIVDDPERVRPYLAFRKVHQRRAGILAARRAVTKVRIDLHAPQRPRLPMQTAGGVALGAKSGPTVVAYTNYVCALCRVTHAELDRLLARQPVPRIILRDFAQDAAATDAAALVRCAARKGRATAARRIVLDGDPASDPQWLEPMLKQVAASAAMSQTDLERCIASREIRTSIEDDTRSAYRLGFDDPPGFVAGGVPLSGMQTAELLRAALDEPAVPETADTRSRQAPATADVRPAEPPVPMGSS